MRKIIPNIAAVIVPFCVRETLSCAKGKNVYVQNIPHKVCRIPGCCYTRHLNTKCYQHICLIINRYMASSILMLQDTLRYCTVGASSYRSLSRLLPFLANTVPSYLLLVLVHRPGLRGHRFSRLFDCYLSGHIKDTIYRHKLQTREEIFESANCMRRSDGIIKRCAEL